MGVAVRILRGALESVPAIFHIPSVPKLLRNQFVFNFQEDVNGEKLTVKNWWIFGADFFMVWCRFFHGLSPRWPLLSTLRPYFAKKNSSFFVAA